MLLIDDSIMQKGKPATAGSEILEHFTALFDATAVTKLNENNRTIDGTVTLPEFGLSAPETLPEATILCNDVFGHVRRRAAAQGLAYIRPTYGTVSRYGLIPTASSMDQIGIVCQNPSEGFDLLSEIAGFDEKDGAMLPGKDYNYTTCDGFKMAEANGTPQFDAYINEVMMILASAEISNNINRYDGIKFGVRAAGTKGLNGLYTKTRTERFGEQTKLTAIMGCMVLSGEFYELYYTKAMQLRRVIKESLKIEKNEVIPVSPDNPVAVLCGLPSLTFGDCQWVAAAGCENVLLAAWRNKYEL
jgi:aspartyl-tRNA(Asn)/glutamyl-tRNA(Gln) amidotransferase subunit A